MKRPILIITMGYIIGIIWGVYIKTTILPIIILYPIYSIISKKMKYTYTNVTQVLLNSPLLLWQTGKWSEAL